MQSTKRSYQEYIWDRMVTFTYIGTEEVPPFELVTSASVLAFTNEGKLIAVNTKKRGVDLPGGHVEPHEIDPLETLKREIMEEAYIAIHSPELVEVIESDYFSDRKSYMLIYVACVDNIGTFIPTDEISERLIVNPKEFIELYRGNDKPYMTELINESWKKLEHRGI